MRIKVTYDGSFPNACSGTLTIWKDDKIIYKKSLCCRSTGTVWFDDGWNEHIEDGELVWEDSNQFDAKIQLAVESELRKIGVCCGGCV